MIKVGEGTTFKTIEEASDSFKWNPFINIDGKPTREIKATFPIGGNYYAWFPYDITGKPHKGWIDFLDESKTEMIVSKENWSEKKRKEKFENDKSRKFVTFAKINKQDEYEFIGIFELVPEDENIFLKYKRTSEKFDGI